MAGRMQDVARLRDLVGDTTFTRGTHLCARGAVHGYQWHESGRLFGSVQGSRRDPYTQLLRVELGADGALLDFSGRCTCPVGGDCKHAVALLLTALDDLRAGEKASAAPPSMPAEWERVLAPLLTPLAPAPERAPRLGLQFELSLVPAAHRYYDDVPARLAVRPVRTGAKGTWLRTGLSWQSLTFGLEGADPAQLAVLRELRAIGLGPPPAYGAFPAALALTDVDTFRLWTVLREARDAGVALVGSRADGAAVTLVDEPASLRLAVTQGDDALTLRPVLTAGGAVVHPGRCLFLGDPAHGIAWWSDAPPGEAPELSLAPLDRVVDDDEQRLLEHGPVTVDGRDRERFFGTAYPVLRRRLTVVSDSPELALPEPAAPQLQATIRPLPDHAIELAWAWLDVLGPARTVTPLGLMPGPSFGPDDGHLRRALLAAVIGCASVEMLEPGPRLAAAVTLTGMAAVRFARDIVPVLADVDGVVLDLVGALPDYREAASAPVVTLGDAAESLGGSDWFDLSLSMSVDGESVPFESVLRGLATGDDHLILPSGTYFSLRSEQLAALAALVAEARALRDTPRDRLRLSRYQESLWDELDRLTVVTGQAARWRESLRALGASAGTVPVDVPGGLKAELRPYQHSGFEWLVFLHRHGLGGILADDMGLGKTLQTLALMAHVREEGRGGAPFLVVAPTSVVHNWVAECERFTPGLRAVAVTETVRRRRNPLAEVAAGADVVVTSYTLFRLEHADYQALAWDGLILDEAQNVKNHKSTGYRCARTLGAPFTLAITGTPLENNLTELWSLLSVAAPGLFPQVDRFQDFYATPIERGGDPERLALLRRRIKPFVLRRTKDEVLTELPDKQEQVLELDLNPRHRKIYDTYLARERQKVLGLLDNLDRNRFEVLKSLTLLRQACLEASLADEQHQGVPSAKLDALMELLVEAVADGHGVLVFSQFTRFLSMARDRLTAAGIPLAYLDGRTRHRDAVVARFRSGEVPVFLVSLKAGGVGLTLTEADYCVLLDPWWNPATEAQAVDRTHRIGQTRKVMVYRLVARDTIEEKVMALKARKAELFRGVLDGGEFGSGALTASDIRGLLD